MTPVVAQRCSACPAVCVDSCCSGAIQTNADGSVSIMSSSVPVAAVASQCALCKRSGWTTVLRAWPTNRPPDDADDVQGAPSNSCPRTLRSMFALDPERAPLHKVVACNSARCRSGMHNVIVASHRALAETNR